MWPIYWEIQMKRMKGFILGFDTLAVVMIVGLFGVLVTNGGQNLTKAEVEPVTVAEAK